MRVCQDIPVRADDEARAQRFRFEVPGIPVRLHVAAEKFEKWVILRDIGHPGENLATHAGRLYSTDIYHRRALSFNQTSKIRQFLNLGENGSGKSEQRH